MPKLAQKGGVERILPPLELKELVIMGGATVGTLILKQSERRNREGWPQRSPSRRVGKEINERGSYPQTMLSVDFSSKK